MNAPHASARDAHSTPAPSRPRIAHRREQPDRRGGVTNQTTGTRPPGRTDRRRSAAPLRLCAPDGVPLGGFVWRHGETARPVVVIAPATSVRCRYYARFADDLFAKGFDVVTFDYRGIGESRPVSLRGFRADWVDWGEHDLEAALRYAVAEFRGAPIHVVAHSIGGFALGLAPSNRKIERILTVGAQFAHWRDYGAARRYRMLWKWHVAMPALTQIFGYFPAKRLGWMEDTPAGVVRDWSRMTARFEDTVRRGSFIAGERESELLVRRFAEVTAPILAIGVGDDTHGTPAAVDRLLAYFTASLRRHRRIAPSDIGAPSIGHFAFFHDRFKDSLWPLAQLWLRNGEIAPDAPGRMVAEMLPRQAGR
ncbi:alpha/beta hydrolase [Acuticoccus sediminis]|uniref:Alpha/beta hydrolase n=2 Tax=Acuticoccus sediminis TaxID=2184697 RepID=A0A8B2NH68_9HYPH|nr:alpha/beta hydrolase [Acuticoccus sediminis]